MKDWDNAGDGLLITREEIFDEIRKIERLESKLGHFNVPEAEYLRFDKFDFASVLTYVANAELLEMYRESMRVYDDNGIARPYYTQRALPTIKKGVPIILSFEETYLLHTDMIIKTNPKEDSKIIIEARDLPSMWPQKIEYKTF